jgi:hypothetical protein
MLSETNPTLRHEVLTLPRGSCEEQSNKMCLHLSSLAEGLLAGGFQDAFTATITTTSDDSTSRWTHGRESP